MYFRTVSKFLCSKSNLELINRGISKITLEECPKPLPPMNIALIGGNSDVGQIAALFLKQYQVICKINIFDCEDTSRVACDLNQINSLTKIIPYSGLRNLECALCGTRIIVICGCHQTKPDVTEKELFRRNAARVRQAIMYCTEFAPHASIVIATPPVSCMVPMAIEEFRKADIFADRRIFGFVRTLVCRTNCLISKHLQKEFNRLNSLVVGGTHRRTFVPIISTLKQASKIKLCDNEVLTRSIQEAEEDILYQKYYDKNTQGAYLSTGLALAKFVVAVAKGLQGNDSITECAYVRQQEPLSNFAKYMTTLIKIGPNGIESSYLPKLSKQEVQRLNLVVEDIRHNIHIGESYVTGNDRVMKTHRPKKTEPQKLPPLECVTPVEPKPKDVCKKVRLRTMKLTK